jgi:hypothetical protein
MRDRCPKCNSEDLTLERNYALEDDGNIVWLDSYDAYCKDCGWEFVLVEL